MAYRFLLTCCSLLQGIDILVGLINDAHVLGLTLKNQLYANLNQRSPSERSFNNHVPDYKILPKTLQGPAQSKCASFYLSVFRSELLARSKIKNLVRIKTKELC